MDKPAKTIENISIAKQGDPAIMIEVIRTWAYPAGEVTLTHYEIELADKTRSKKYQNYANALKAWVKAYDSGKVAK